jgi:hypothetical protein
MKAPFVFIVMLGIVEIAPAPSGWAQSDAVGASNAQSSRVSWRELLTIGVWFAANQPIPATGSISPAESDFMETLKTTRTAPGQPAALAPAKVQSANGS